MRIGQLAADAGLTTKTIRYYEQIGLLPPPSRSPAGYRDYPPTAVPRLRFVRTAQAAGLTLAEIASILAIRDNGQPPCSHVAALIGAHLDDIHDRILALQAAQAELEALSHRAAELDPADCADTAGVCRIIVAG